MKSSYSSIKPGQVWLDIAGKRIQAHGGSVMYIDGLYYVCWLKIMNKDKTQTATVLTADNILGPYTKVKEGFRPLDMDAGDFDR